MTVYDNIRFPLKVRSVPKHEIDGAIREAARQVRDRVSVVFFAEGTRSDDGAASTRASRRCCWTWNGATRSVRSRYPRTKMCAPRWPGCA